MPKNNFGMGRKGKGAAVGIAFFTVGAAMKNPGMKAIKNDQTLTALFFIGVALSAGGGAVAGWAIGKLKDHICPCPNISDSDDDSSDDEQWLYQLNLNS